jgi:hypothetical protein
MADAHESGALRLPESGRLGFLEGLVALAAIGILVLATLPWLFSTLSRARLTRSARDAVEMVELARLQATKLAVRTYVSFDTGSRTFSAFADVDGSARYEADVDFALGAPLELPRAIELMGPSDPAPGGAHAVVGLLGDLSSGQVSAVFLPDGAALAGGAFRLADLRGNFLEVRIPVESSLPVQLRKWAGGPDPEDNWLEGNRSGHPWRWD